MIGRGLGVALLLAAAARGGWAGPTAEQAAEREAIRSERAAVEARYRAAERECRERFVVASCIEEQKALEREALAELRRRELALDDAVRRADAEEAARRVQAKQAEIDRRAPASRARAGAASQPQAREAAPLASAPAAAAPRRSPTAEDPAKAAERAQAQQRRASEAQARREAAERRNAQRAAKQKAPAAPLPVPDAASAPQP
jgi:hypothetical protein